MRPLLRPFAAAAAALLGLAAWCGAPANSGGAGAAEDVAAESERAPGGARAPDGAAPSAGARSLPRHVLRASAAAGDGPGAAVSAAEGAPDSSLPAPCGAVRATGRPILPHAWDRAHAHPARAP